MLVRNSTFATLALAALALGTGCNDPSKESEASTTASSTSEGTDIGIGPNGNVNVPANLLQSIDPAKGSIWGGDPVTLTGDGFAQGAEVTFDGDKATDVQVVSSTEITCKTPAHQAGVVDVVLTLPSGKTGRLNNGFTYDPNIGTYAREADYGDPTGAEQELLELINRARRDPAAEGQRLGLDFSQYPPTPPLSYNTHLADAALAHTNEMAQSGQYGHELNGDGPTGRLLDAGYPLNKAFQTNGQFDRSTNYSENIGASNENRFRDPQQVHDILMRDEGIPKPKHREMMLSYGGHFPKNREVGIGYRIDQQSPGQFEHFITQEFARSQTDRPFITGVVYQDQSGDEICRDGEGEGGVDVTLEHSSGFTIDTQTAKAGGYAFEILRDGTYTITIRGESTQVTVQGGSVKVDLRNGLIETY